MITIEKLEVDVANEGHITNCYLVYDENKESILIDPGYDATKIIRKIEMLGLNLKYIAITHAHADHIGALENVAKKYSSAKILVHENDYPSLVNEQENYCDMLNVEKQSLDIKQITKVKDKDNIFVGNLEFEIIHTPGHTSGCICLYEKTSNVLFTGDTIFCDCYGRCDLYSGDFENMVNSLRKLFNRFNDNMIYPGHDKIVNIESAKKRIRLLMALKGVTM